jgi:excinuclease ABC subunit C
LSGQSRQLIYHFEKDMKKASQKQNYEAAQEAKKIRDGLEFLTQNRISPDLLLANLDLANNHQEQVDKLAQILQEHFPKLNKINRIETYDIANLSGQEATGSMAVFVKGQADTGQYRHFKIKLPPQPNDPKMMAEVLDRRLDHPEWPWPDLAVVDGGKPQVAAAQKVLDQKKLAIALIGLAKREETIIIKKRRGFVSLSLDKNDPALLLLRATRDEAHRFAQRYHHYLRGKQYQ